MWPQRVYCAVGSGFYTHAREQKRRESAWSGTAPKPRREPGVAGRDAGAAVAAGARGHGAASAAGTGKGVGNLEIGLRVSCRTNQHDGVRPVKMLSKDKKHAKVT